ncbi:MAG: nucleotidyltransferase family protein [Patescibacteria group bacterium]
MDRTRLTITLKPQLRQQIDRTVDGARVRNRSHAIELLLEKALGASHVPFIILAGGKGVANHNGGMPKALLEVHGEPVIVHTVRQLQRQGLHEGIVVIGKGGSLLKSRFGDGTSLSVLLRYIDQSPSSTGTAPAVRTATASIGDQTCIVQYGDVYAEIDYNELLSFHRAHRAWATVALTSVEQPAMWGVATMQGSHIIDFTEKPKPRQGNLSHLVNAGIYVLEPEAAQLIPLGSGQLEYALFPRLAQEGRLYGYPFEGEWRDVGQRE